MRAFVLCWFLVASVSAAYLPIEREKRDVSELSYNYLPPESRLALPEEVTTEVITADEPTTVGTKSVNLGNNGYEYRTVRRLKYRYRTRRDVSHLAQHYLPPPNKKYLPPQAQEMDDSEVVQAAEPKISNEYLPPNEDITTEAPVTEEPVVEDEQSKEDPTELLQDGYHYKKPAGDEQTFKMGKEQALEYLPPVDDDMIIIEEVGPKETAVLADDGYHYRTIKRFRF